MDERGKFNLESTKEAQELLEAMCLTTKLSPCTMKENKAS